MNTIDMPS